MGEYRRARGSLHVRGAFWLRSQVPIRRAKGPSFTQDEDMYVVIIANMQTKHDMDTTMLATLSLSYANMNPDDEMIIMREHEPRMMK